MKQHRQFLAFTGFVALGLVLVFLFAPTNTQTSSASPLYLGITLTPSNVPPPTNTPDPFVPTNTPVATATSMPEDPNNQEEDLSPVVLPESGVGAPEVVGKAPGAFIPGPAPALSQPLVQRLEIPSLQVNAWIRPVVFNGSSWDVSSIYAEVSWLAESAVPWENQNTVITGHIRFKNIPVPFQDLPRIKTGSLIYLHTMRGVYTYRVEEQKQVEPEDLSVLDPGISARLTLITCTKWDRVSSTYTKRQVVVAALVRTFFTRPAVRRGYFHVE